VRLMMYLCSHLLRLVLGNSWCGPLLDLLWAFWWFIVGCGISVRFRRNVHLTLTMFKSILTHYNSIGAEDFGVIFWFNVYNEQCGQIWNEWNCADVSLMMMFFLSASHWYYPQWNKISLKLWSVNTLQVHTIQINGLLCLLFHMLTLNSH
jgi:hypothetical protein